jgi:exo-1,4-beta-D-glucosaminidase
MNRYRQMSLIGLSAILFLLRDVGSGAQAPPVARGNKSAAAQTSRGEKTSAKATAGKQGAAKNQSSKTFLHKDWRVQSSCEDKAAGDKISMSSFDAGKWHRTDIPSTVVAVLVDDRTLPDPTYSTNLKTFPGMHNDDQTFFANVDMSKDSPFRCSWWYRTEFKMPVSAGKRTDWLHFNGINYRANVWINGKKVADAKDVAGTYRTFEFDISQFVKHGATNALAVEVFAPGKDDLGITWVDWNPTPPDKNMGIWKEVFLTQSADVTVRNPFVASRLGADYKTAALTLSADVHNVATHPVRGILRAEIEIDKIKLSQPVSLAAGETKTVHFAPEKFAVLKYAHPHLWWPYTMGEPYLYNAKFSFQTGTQVSEFAATAFGIREVTSELTDKNFRLFKINGRNILIRGAAWAPELLFRWVPGKLDEDLAYVHDMGMNTIRLEGRLDREEFYEKTDRLGILVMPGWTCCDAWERWKDWQGDQREIAAASLRSQIHILRKHPSVFVWLNGSDGPPPADVESMYLDILKELEWPNPSVSSASETATTVTGKSGVKMTGPYEYVPPVYWLTDTQAGGAHGYNTETSPGPAIPTKESLERFIPKDHLWPIDDMWNYHAGKERFTTINVFADGLNRRYGTATSLDDFERKAQAVTYDGQRAMFEAYARNKYTSTGVIQWMLNNAWPSLIWHLYDYYMVPAGGYFGTKKACEPVHVQYSYDSNSVAVINGTYAAIKGVKVSAKIYNLDASEKGTKDATVDLAPDSSTTAFDLPKPSEVDGLSKTYFLRLQLHDGANKLLSDNFYWLSTKPYTPQAEFGDLSGLATLPEVKLDVTAMSKHEAEKTVTRVTVKTLGNNVAFMIHLRAAHSKDGTDIAPILWEDNYFSLLPGEEREVTASYLVTALGGDKPVLEVEGFNVEKQTVEASGSTGGVH